MTNRGFPAGSFRQGEGSDKKINNYNYNYLLTNLSSSCRSGLSLLSCPVRRRL